MISYTKQPHAREYRLIFKNIDRIGWDPSIETYMADGGYDDLKKAFAMAPKDITEGMFALSHESVAELAETHVGKPDIDSLFPVAVALLSFLKVLPHSRLRNRKEAVHNGTRPHRLRWRRRPDSRPLGDLGQQR